jgi:ABC-type spermidine/putrescine transport system permease subunit I
MALLPFAVLLLLIVLPAVDSLLFSLGRVPANNVAFSTGMHLIRSDHLTLAVYKNLFSSKYFLQDLSLTLVVTVVSVASIVILSYSLALYVRFSRGVFPRMVRTLYLIPMFIPVVIASYALITFWVDHGLMNALFEHLGLHYRSPIYRASGIIIGQVWQGIPFAVLLLSSGLDGLAEEQIEAARDAGARFFTVFWRIVLPLNLVPLLVVATFTFIGIIGSFTIPYLLGPNAPQMFSVAMNAHFVSYNQPQPAVAMAIITFLIAAIAGALYVWGTARTSRSSQ